MVRVIDYPLISELITRRPPPNGSVQSICPECYIFGFASSAVRSIAVKLGFKTAEKIIAAEVVTASAETSPLLARYLAGSGGRWGVAATRQKNHNIASQFESQSYTITGGAGRASEEWIAGASGGTRGGRLSISLRLMESIQFELKQ